MLQVSSCFLALINAAWSLDVSLKFNTRHFNLTIEVVVFLCLLLFSSKRLPKANLQKRLVNQRLSTANERSTRNNMDQEANNSANGEYPTGRLSKLNSIISRRSILREFDPLYRSPNMIIRAKLQRSGEEAVIIETSEDEEKENLVLIEEKKLTEDEERDRLEKELQRAENGIKEYELLIEQYEEFYIKEKKELEVLTTDCRIEKQHLSEYESTFLELFQKYENCKPIIKGLETDEEALRKQMSIKQDILAECEAEYEKLKAACTLKINECDKEIYMQRSKYKHDAEKLSTLKQIGEIKIFTLKAKLEELTKEYEQMLKMLEK